MVFGESDNCSAICTLEYPSTVRCSTSRSRTLRRSKALRVAAAFVTFQIVFLSKTFLIVLTIKIRALMGLDVRSSDMFPRNLSRIFDRLTLTVTYLSRYWREKVFWHVRQVKVDSSPKEAMERASVARVFSRGLSSTSDRSG